jgi:hypothetical protein
VSSVLSTYKASLEKRAREASPGLGWYLAVSKASIPWVVAMIPAIVVAWLGIAPFWVVVVLWAIPMASWIFVQVAMIAEISRSRGQR